MMRAATAFVMAILVMAPPGVAQAQTPDRVFAVDSSSTEVTFVAHHMGVLKVTGRFTGITGVLKTVVGRTDSMAAHIVIPVRHVQTGNAMRDRSLRSAAFLDAASFPTILFDTDRVSPDTGTTHVSAGRLTVKGQAHPLRFSFDLRRSHAAGGEVLSIVAAFTVRRQDVGLVFDSPMDPLIGDEVEITVHLRAQAR